MSTNEIGIEEGRKRFGDLVIAAEKTGQVTIVTRYGKPAAAITPVKEPAVTADAIAAQIKSLYGDLKTALADDQTGDLHTVLSDLADAQFDAADAVRQIMRQTSGDTADHAQSAALTLTNAGSDLLTAADHAQPTTA